ncbi:UNVERIFIED_CONTAM: Symplekin [Sesamum calycinum]|uniref:Symplekin n=1 Tax=Sesamum calycinum TaxID=2727403 RepID=A0AAW2QM68_9LAMI
MWVYTLFSFSLEPCVPNFEIRVTVLCPDQPFIVCIAAIARKRPIYYKSVLSALLDFAPSFESRERLIRELRAMNAGDAADQDDQLSNQLHVSGDVTKKRLAPVDNEDLNNSSDTTSKRLRYGLHNNIPATVDFNDARQDHVNGISPKLPVSDGDLTPEEQIIAMIGALIAEGERGLESLEILISNIHPDLLADIVITNMKHLPNNPPPLTRYSNLSLNRPSDSSSDPSQDPRRLDPRRMVVPVDAPPSSVVEDTANPVQYLAAQSDNDASSLSNPSVLPPPPSISESTSDLVMPSTETDLNLSESPLISEGNQSIPKFEVQDVEDNEFTPGRETSNGLHHLSSPISKVEDSVVQASIDVAVLDEAYSPSSSEADQLSPDRSTFEASEIASTEFPVLPLYIGLAEEHQRNTRRLALERIINSYQNSHRTDLKQTQIALVARLFAQTDVNDVIGMVQQRIVSDYEQQKGHELVMYILYHLHSLVISDPASSAAVVYEKFLLGVAKSLLGDLPASDKSFSRLLGEVPCIPDSVLGLLGDICTRSQSGSDGRDGDRVTQGLGAVWSLILGRPGSRKACLDIALKCTIHPKDDVRAKAIRLVSNKLYAISYLSENIEQFATDMFLSAIDQRFSDSVVSQSADSEKRVGGQSVRSFYSSVRCVSLLGTRPSYLFENMFLYKTVESAETSISGSQASDPEISQNDNTKGVQNASLDDTSIPSLQAYSLMSLFFALCTKKPTLLQLVFDSYGRAQKAVKQAVHRHISVLMRAMGSSFSQLLGIISNPPHGSEDLLTQVLHALCEGITPPPDLVATVKGLYETRLKDATILIPIISAFSKDEVLPIFPRLVQLPLNKFQMALAHILQGSAHTGPALTPAEVLVAIHDISPEKDGLPLKKITDACSACFEQRTVFTQQVLTKALNQMVDRTPLPLLYMRTVIQAIDAFPTLVDFVMEILSKLVNRQIWRMPKLWVGFLKCISQTQPHSFRVLLQLPPPQLESALNKYPNLRGPLTAFVNQSSVQTSLPRLDENSMFCLKSNSVKRQSSSESKGEDKEKMICACLSPRSSKPNSRNKTYCSILISGLQKETQAFYGPALADVCLLVPWIRSLWWICFGTDFWVLEERNGPSDMLLLVNLHFASVVDGGE